jgi:hypothetical protein
MSNKYMVHAFNLVRMAETIITGTGVDTNYPIKNLLDSRLPVRLKFAEGAATTELILNVSAVPPWRRKCERIGFTAHNLSDAHPVSAYANPTDSWVSPDKSITGLTVSADPDTDPDTWGETNITLQPYRTVVFNLGEDILSGNNFVKIAIAAPVGYDPIEFGFLFAGSGLQAQRNYSKRSEYGFNDPTVIIRGSDGFPFHNAKLVRDVLRLEFPWSKFEDDAMARYFIEHFGAWGTVLISLEPERDAVAYAPDGMRSQRLSYYGRGQIKQFVNPGINIFPYGLEFKEEFTNLGANASGIAVPQPPPQPEPEPEDVIPAGTRIVRVNLWVVINYTPAPAPYGPAYDNFNFNLGGSNLLLNPSFESAFATVPPLDWELGGSGGRQTTHHDYDGALPNPGGEIDINPESGSYFFGPNHSGGVTRILKRQDIDVSANAAAIDAGTQGYALSFRYSTIGQSDPTSGKQDGCRVTVEFYDAAITTLLGTADTGELQSAKPNNAGGLAVWSLFTL